ncbi:hypothetical protein [Cryobacterium fucosi]|uniref:PH domain-containing protein n=1 Tax=Cryobacterium fucosi TaxID=1259157 RepID=A0A4R9B454_9MICO|nr:hypothetical protein [Cryobacterium fucosi]TFD75573.1 hypothetical protein E3T48_11640 [Cryobacterium fucosi]
MDRAIPAVITALVMLGLLALMMRSWRARGRRDAALPAGYPLPAETTPELASAAAFYVATTRRGTPLERLNIRGLGFRARAAVTVTEAGVFLYLSGEEAVFIPADAIELLEPATWTIDRAVEPDGLLLLGWRLNAPAAETGEIVDSYFRIIDPAERVTVNDAIRTIAAGALSPAEHDESEA